MSPPSRTTLVAGQHGPGARLDLEEAEHRANLRRLRWVMPLATVIWVSFLPIDYLMATAIEPGPFWVYLLLRLLVLPPAVYMSVRTRTQPHMTRQQVHIMGAILFVLASWSISVMSAFGAGPRGLYFAGVGATITARAVPLAEPYRQSVPIYAAMVLGHGALLGSIWWARGQPADMLAIGTQLVLLTDVAVLSCFGSHALWSARRLLLERTAVGRYSLVSLLGAGGMGEVWRASTPQLRRDVAVKLLPAGTETVQSIALFEREASALSQLGHPHTVRIFDFGVSADGVPFYVMELLDGEDLAARLTREPALSPQVGLTIARQLASALAEAHRLSIVHRDVKPQNVFLVAGMGGAVHAKLLDFGIASLDGDSGDVVGTPGYVAPELIAGRAPLPAADIYAVGCLLHRIWLGRPVFERATTAETLRAHQHEAARPPWGPSPPPELVPVQEVMMRCLAKNPSDRFTDGAALLAALESLSLPPSLPPSVLGRHSEAPPTLDLSQLSEHREA